MADRERNKTPLVPLVASFRAQVSGVRKTKGKIAVFINVLFILSVLLGVWDFTVRNVDSIWTENQVAQLMVFLSPIVHLSFLSAVLVKLSYVVSGYSRKIINIASIALISLAIITSAQIYLNGTAVGSASYSVVKPLYVSGIPISFLTFFVYFGSGSGFIVPGVIALVCVLWFFAPIAIDLLYTSHGGFRGPQASLDIAVLGTTFDLIMWFVAYGVLFAPFVALGVTARLLYLLYQNPREDRLVLQGVGFSLLAFTHQVLNWGWFVWD